MIENNSEQVLKMAKDLIDKYQVKNDKIGKPRILVAGKTGVGKSTLLNAIFSKSLAEVGIGKPVTQEITEYESDDFPLIIADSKGLEGQDYEEIVKDLVSYIQKHNGTGEEKDAVHLAWFCVSAPGGRFEDGEAALVKAIHQAGIPVIVVMTQGRLFRGNTFREETNESKLRDYISNKLGNSADDIILVRAQTEEDEDDDGNVIFKKPKGLDRLIEVTNKILPKGQKNAFVQALNVRNEKALSLKENAAREIVNWATAAATTAAAVPIPGSDFLSLAPIQGTMLYKIGNIYGINTEGTNWSNVITAVATPLLGGMMARAAVGSVLKFIPVAGTLLGGIISGASAGGITKIMGEIYINVLHDMTKESLSDGNETPITAEKAFEGLAEAIKRKKDTDHNK